MQRDGNFYSLCLPGKLRKATRKFQRTGEGDRIFFGECPKSDKMSVISTPGKKIAFVSSPAKRAEYIRGIYRGIYLVVLYKYNEKILL